MDTTFSISQPLQGAVDPPNALTLGSVHPRVCGEATVVDRTTVSTRGSSPRVRGSRLAALTDAVRERSVPAVVPASHVDTRLHLQPAGEPVAPRALQRRPSGSASPLPRSPPGVRPGCPRRRWPPTHSGSALHVSSKPLAPPAPSSPRVPAAAIFVDSPLSRAGPPWGVSNRRHRRSRPRPTP